MSLELMPQLNTPKGAARKKKIQGAGCRRFSALERGGIHAFYDTELGSFFGDSNGPGSLNETETRIGR